MSGGHFNGAQSHMLMIAEDIDKIIEENNSKEFDTFGYKIGYDFPQDIISKLEETKKVLVLAEAMTKRVDYLVCGDDGEDSFRRRWEEEVEQLKTTQEYDKNKERIICSAIWFKDGKKYENQPQNIQTGYVLCGFRHSDCMSNVFVFGAKNIPDNIQGFMTSKNKFVDRKEALKIAIKQGIIDEKARLLLSEDLY